MDHKPIEEQLKEFEIDYNLKLPLEVPIILRFRGSSFYRLAYDAYFERPFDSDLNLAFGKTAREVCKKIPGSKFAYVQSDEFSVLIYLEDHSPWFKNDLQEVISASTGLASVVFYSHIKKFIRNDADFYPYFDVKAFVIPKCEVRDYFKWRQEVGIRNSVNMLARHHFSAKSLYKVGWHKMKVMLKENQTPWENWTDWAKYGVVVTKDGNFKFQAGGGAVVHFDEDEQFDQLMTEASE